MRLVLMLLALALPAAAQTRIVAYFTESAAAQLRYTPQTMITNGAAPLISQLNYAFGRVANDRCVLGDPGVDIDHAYSAADSVDGSADPSGPNQLRGTFHQLQELKRKYPDLKVLIALGGWGGSAGFPDAAEPAHARAFVRSCIDTFIRGEFAPGINAPGIFDGIDLDWEYPVSGGGAHGRPEDKHDLTLLAAEFRRQLDSVKPGLLLTAAVPADESFFTNIELRALSQHLDHINLMSYDMHSGSEPTTNFQSALFADPDDPTPAPARATADHAVELILAAGVPPQKIFLGVPFYGKAWSNVADRNHGLFQHGSKPPQQESWTPYSSLHVMPPSADRFFDAKAISCSIWNNGTFWSYDCPDALRGKLDYIRKRELGGVMVWELSQDTADSELLRTLAAPTK